MYTNKYLLSKYRPQLMGVAICMIMGFHTGIIPWGDLGVEWFYILSGLGLYYSLSKKPDLLHFYKKRFIRIIPTYLMLVVPTAIIFQDKLKIGILSTIFQYDTILGNMGYMTWWFLVLLLLFYVIAPVIFRWGGLTIMLVISLLIFLYSLIGNMDIIPFNKMFINRLPIVLVSIPLGGYILNGAIQEQTNKGKSLIIATVTLVFFILIRLFTIKYSDVLSQYVNVDNIQFIFKYCISIPSMLLVAIFFESIENQLIKYTAGFIGSITLEIYLVHEYFCKEIASLIFDYWLFNAILSYIIAIPLAYLLKVISAKALSIFPTLN